MVLLIILGGYSYFSPKITSQPVLDPDEKTIFLIEGEPFPYQPEVRFDVPISWHLTIPLITNGPQLQASINLDTGKISWNCNSEGVWDITVTASNWAGRDSQSFKVKYIIKPFIKINLPSTIIAQQDFKGSLEVSGSQPLEISCSNPDIKIEEADNFKPQSSFYWENPKDGKYTIQFTASNPAGKHTRNWDVTVKRKPVKITSEPQKTTMAGIDYEYQVKAIGTPEFQWQLEDAPEGMSIGRKGIVLWPADFAREGNYNVSIKVSNIIESKTCTDTQSFTLQCKKKKEKKIEKQKKKQSKKLTNVNVKRIFKEEKIIKKQKKIIQDQEKLLEELPKQFKPEQKKAIDVQKEAIKKAEEAKKRALQLKKQKAEKERLEAERKEKERQRIEAEKLKEIVSKQEEAERQRILNAQKEAEQREAERQRILNAQKEAEKRELEQQRLLKEQYEARQRELERQQLLREQKEREQERMQQEALRRKQEMIEKQKLARRKYMEQKKQAEEKAKLEEAARQDALRRKQEALKRQQEALRKQEEARIRAEQLKQKEIELNKKKEEARQRQLEARKKYREEQERLMEEAQKARIAQEKIAEKLKKQKEMKEQAAEAERIAREQRQIEEKLRKQKKVKKISVPTKREMSREKIEKGKKVKLRYDFVLTGWSFAEFYKLAKSRDFKILFMQNIQPKNYEVTGLDNNGNPVVELKTWDDKNYPSRGFIVTEIPTEGKDSWIGFNTHLRRKLKTGTKNMTLFFPYHFFAYLEEAARSYYNTNKIDTRLSFKQGAGKIKFVITKDYKFQIISMGNTK